MSFIWLDIGFKHFNHSYNIYIGTGDWQFCGSLATLFSCVIWTISLCYGISEVPKLPAILEVCLFNRFFSVVMAF